MYWYGPNVPATKYIIILVKKKESKRGVGF